MGIKINKFFKKIDKSTVVVLLIGILLISVSVGGLAYVSSKSAENRLYMFNNSKAPKDSFIDGMKINFKKENISCFGLVKFNCSIKNAEVREANSNIRLFDIENIDVGSFSRKGIMIGNNVDLYFNLTNITTNQDYPLVQKMTEEGKQIKDILVPFDMSLIYKMKVFKTRESILDFKLSYSSKLGKADVSGNLNVLKEKNIIKINKNLEIERNASKAIGEKVISNKMVTILTEFEVNIENKRISDFMYLMYKKEFNYVKNEKDRERVNIYAVGIESSKIVDKSIFDKEIDERLSDMIPDQKEEELKDYLKAFIYLKEKEGNNVKIVGENKGRYTIDELQLLSDINKLTTDQLKYFKLKITTGEK